MRDPSFMGRSRGRDRQLERADDVEVTLTCVVCARPIVLRASAEGVVLPDRSAFLEQHARCVAQRRAVHLGGQR